jgi:amidase
VRIEPHRRDLLAAGAATALSAAIPAGAAIADSAASSKRDDFAYREAGDLVRALAAKKVSSAELTDFAIARIDQRDAPINAVVVRDFARAREAAKAADAALARGETRPLLGLPITVKEAFNVAGLPTTWGNPKFRGWQPDFDALAVARLKAVGAVILGKTNVPFMLEDWQSYNEIYGTTNNPWDRTRTPGGSSGGSAAALAAGFVALELGTDIGGSLRCPAHFCSVFAHKPSLDLVPMRGAAPPHVPNVPNDGLGLAVAGPMARSAADLALALDILAGPDERDDGIAYKLALPPARHQDLKSFRVLVVDRHPLCPTAADVSAALDGLADGLGRAGATVARASPSLPDLGDVTRLHVELLAAASSADLDGDVYHRLSNLAQGLSPDDPRLAAARLHGLTMRHRDWVWAGRRREAMRERVRHLFAEFDVMLCPPMPTLAFPHDHSKDRLARQIIIDGQEVPYGDQIVWTSLATLLGLPATVAPIGRNPQGLPIGVQIIGPALEDRTPIAFAGLIEREFGGFVAPAGG